MRRDGLRILGFVLMVFAIVVLVISFDDIKTMANEAIIDWVNSSINQMFR